MANRTKNNYAKLPNFRTDGSNQDTIERTVDQLRDTVVKVLDSLSSDPVNNGNLLQVSLVINKPNYVEHKLGRKYRDFSVYQNNTGSRIWVSSKANDKPELFIILQTSQDCDVTLRII